MNKLIVFMLIAINATILMADGKEIVAQYTDLNGITYVRYEGETKWVTTVPNQPNANPLLTKDIEPGVNLLIDEGTIAIEYYDHSGMYSNGGMTDEDTHILSADPELNSFNIIPNPPEDNLNLSFSLEQSGEVEIMIYEYTGKLVRPLIKQSFESGMQEITIPINEFPNDKYYVTFKVGGKKITKMIYLR